MNNIGEQEPLRKENACLKAKLKNRDEQISRMETPHKKYEDMKHEIRRNCKDKNLTCEEKNHKNYELTLK